MKTKVWKFVVLFAVLLMLIVGIYMIFFIAPRAVANLVLQVNPAITLTLSERNTVISAKGLDTQGESLLAGLDVTGKQVPEALRVIAEALREAGLLEDGRRLLIALHPVENRLGEAELTALTENVRQVFGGYVAEHGLLVDVVSVPLTAELTTAVHDLGLLPADYVDLVEEVGSPMAMQVLNLQKELGLDSVLFKEEFSTIASALNDMKEAGIAGDDALAILNGTLIADPKLEELTTITAAMIDLHEAGATQGDIMSVFALLEGQVAAGVDRTLLLEEVTTITAAKIDMLEAGIPAAIALDVLGTALAADPTLEELTTITSAMIDLIEEGLSKEEALIRIQAAIKADPTLDDFDDLIEIPEDEEEDLIEIPDNEEEDLIEVPRNEEEDEVDDPLKLEPDEPELAGFCHEVITRAQLREITNYQGEFVFTEIEEYDPVLGAMKICEISTEETMKAIIFPEADYETIIQEIRKMMGEAATATTEIDDIGEKAFMISAEVGGMHWIILVDRETRQTIVVAAMGLVQQDVVIELAKQVEINVR